MHGMDRPALKGSQVSGVVTCNLVCETEYISVEKIMMETNMLVVKGIN